MQILRTHQLRAKLAKQEKDHTSKGNHEQRFVGTYLSFPPLAVAAAAATIGRTSLAESPVTAEVGASFNVRRYGATGDGKTLDSPAINAAINACNAAGGGIVYVSPGNYLCGTVILTRAT